MSVRRTIGISLASLVISAGAIAKTPEPKISNHPSHFHSAKPERLAKWNRKARIASCTHTRHSHRAQQRNAGIPPSEAGGGPADEYLGQVHPIGHMEIGTAAWYNWVGGRTASGEILDAVTPTAAHRSLPLASHARVTNLDTGRSVIVKINDRGPWRRRFIIDLSPRAAEAIGVIRTGIAAVTVEPVAVRPSPTDAVVSKAAAFETADVAVAQ
jgi:rare lipoprotein A